MSSDNNGGWSSLASRMHFRPDGEGTRVAIERSGNLKIRPAQHVIDRMRWARGQRLDVLVGSGASLGLVRLVTAPPDIGWRLFLAGGGVKQGLIIKIGRMLHGRLALPGMPEHLKTTIVQTTFVENGIEFRLPWKIPERAEVVDPERKPREARAKGAEDLAGGSSETKPRLNAPADARPRGPVGVEGDTGKRGRAAEAGGSPAADPGAGAEPARIAPHADTPVPRAAAASADAQGRTAGSIPATGATLPIQPKSLAQVDDPAPAAYGQMSAEQTEEFVQAVARGERFSVLAAIIAKPPGRYARGSLGYLQSRLIDRIAAARRALKTVAPQANDAEPPEPPQVPPAVLAFLRTEVVPVLAPLGRKITKTRDGSGLLLDGKPATLEEIVAEANRILADSGDEPLRFETAA